MDSDDTGVISGSSVEPPSGESPDDKEILEMGKPIERGKEKYVFNGENHGFEIDQKFQFSFYETCMRSRKILFIR